MIHRYGLNNWADLDFDYDLLKTNHEASLAHESASSNDNSMTHIPNNRTRLLRTTIMGTDFRMETVFGQ
uniref:Uncharacterized protein n=1 Tax=Strongyloides papillosus TaxID=174720 RepID=A0A0N5B3C7_STREA